MITLSQSKLDKTYVNTYDISMSNPQITNASQARKDFYRLIKKTASGEEVVINLRGTEPVVMLSLEDYEALKETAEVLMIPGALTEIKQGANQAQKGIGISLAKLKKSLK